MQIAAPAPQALAPISDVAGSVLVVDDHPQAQVLIGSFLRRMGYAVTTASNGLEAVEAVVRARPDIVIMDVEMPVMGGFEATERIRAAASERWLPIIFLSATSDSSALINALERGGDDYLIKPISYAVLRAKMQAVSRTLILQRELEERNTLLAAYRAAEEEQNRHAEHVIRRLANQERLEEAVLQHWTAPASLFSGDLVAAALTPSGVLHVMLADGAGHGLAAALSALPVTQPFYRMTEKGYPLSTIVEEINAKIRKLLPVERFVAATVVAVDFHQQVIETWNGGNPPLCVIAHDGRLLHVGKSRNLALGVAPDRLFSAEPEIYHYSEPCQIVACSDGMLEAGGWHANETGVRAMSGAVAAHAPHERLDMLKARCQEAKERGTALDDASAITITCVPGAPVLLQPEPPLASGQPGDWTVRFDLSVEQLRHLDLVPLLHDVVGRMRGSNGPDTKLFLVLSELVTNAIDHGVLRLDSRVKLEADGFQRYAQLRQERLASFTGTVEVKISAVRQDGQRMLSIGVRDSGSGFDFVTALAAEPRPEVPFGRGIPLLKRVCAGLEYRGPGNEAAVLLAIGPSDAADAPAG